MKAQFKTNTKRRYDIDWLRVIAIGLLLIYHIAVAFQPWGVYIGFIQSDKPLESLWIPMSMLNIWRIPLLFFVSGMGVCFAIRKRNWKELLLERTRRILVPFLFGMFIIVPLHVFVWQKYYHQDIQYMIHPVHLWFLGNIFVYVIVLSPLFFYIKQNESSTRFKRLKKLLGSPLGLLIITASFVVEVVLVRPEYYETYAMTLHGFLLGLLAFLFGFGMVYSGEAFWQNVLRWKWHLLILAMLMYLIRLFVFRLQAPNALKAIETCVWIFSLLGLGYRYLNRPSKALYYLSRGAYPIYILHMLFLYAGSYLIFPLGIPTPIKFVLIVAFTMLGCFALYDLIIKRVAFLRPLFGLKKSNNMKPIGNLILKKSVVAIVTVGLLSAGCDKLTTHAQYSYQSPEPMSDGITVGTMDEVNMDVEAVEEAVNEIYRGRFTELHSMLIFRDNKLVFEKYFTGHAWQWETPYHHGDWVEWDETMLHNIHSSTKSITSACIGIAIEQGYIQSVHQSIFDYLPEHQHLKRGGKEHITIEHLLTMTSGLKWREWSAPYSSAENPVIGIWFQDKDPVSYILEKPLAENPGTTFNYSTGNMVLLGQIIFQATNMPIDDFSRKYLFEPLGVDSCGWPVKYENGVDANTLYLTPRAMGKVGLTYLNGGILNGDRIIAEEWVKKSAQPFGRNHGINIPGEQSGRMGYSYSWWTKEYLESGKTIRMYTASGFGGQHIMILPEVNAVVVFTGGNYLTKRPTFKILKKYIIPAMD